MSGEATNLKFPKTEARHICKEDTRSLRALWDESYEAEQAGDIRRALDIHEQILNRELASYDALLRAGWLHYQTASYSLALHFYIRALSVASGEVAPLCGMINCHLALGDKSAAEHVECALRVCVSKANS
jgi:tetratricopeptide (TPR) repeat protein